MIWKVVESVGGESVRVNGAHGAGEGGVEGCGAVGLVDFAIGIGAGPYVAQCLARGGCIGGRCGEIAAGGAAPLDLCRFDFCGYGFGVFGPGAAAECSGHT